MSMRDAQFARTVINSKYFVFGLFEGACTALLTIIKSVEYA